VASTTPPVPGAHVRALESIKFKTLVVQPAHLQRDRSLLLTTLKEYLGPPENEARFEWLYCRGPFGEARAWLLREGDGGTLVGMAAVFPRLLASNGEIVNGCVLGDFCLAPSWRTLGPGVQLQKECLRYLKNGTFVLGYDFPSAGMMVIYQRLGYRSEEELVLGLLEEEGVLIHPGYFFDFPRESYLVVSLLVPEAEFSKGVERLLSRALQVQSCRA